MNQKFANPDMKNNPEIVTDKFLSAVMCTLKMSKSSFLSQSSTIPYEIVDNQDTYFVQEFIEVEKLYFRSDSHVMIQ